MTSSSASGQTSRIDGERTRSRVGEAAVPQHLPAARQHPVVAIWHPDQEGRYQGPKLYRISRQLHHFGSHLLGADRRQSFQVSFSPHSYSASNTAFENYNPQTLRTSQHSVSSSIFSLGTSGTNAADLTSRRQGAQDCILWRQLPQTIGP